MAYSRVTFTFYLLTVQCHFGPDDATLPDVYCTITVIEPLCDYDKCLLL